MSEQLAIDWDAWRKLTIKERFEAFHADNPDVYVELVKLARRAKARGQRRIGIELLFAVCRWRRMMVTVDAYSGFKLNNDYRAHYARLIMEQEPDLEDFFEIRELRSA